MDSEFLASSESKQEQPYSSFSSPSQSLLNSSRALFSRPKSIQPPFFLRLGSDGTLFYISPTLANRLKVEPSAIIGTSCQNLSIFEPFHTSSSTSKSASARSSGLSIPRLLHDQLNQSVYETQVVSAGANILVTLHDVTEAYHLKQYLQRHLPSDFGTLSHAEPASFRLDLKTWAAVSIYRFIQKPTDPSNGDAFLPIDALNKLFELCEKWNASLERVEKERVILRHIQIQTDDSSPVFSAINMACDYQNWLNETHSSQLEPSNPQDSSSWFQASIAITTGETAVRLQSRDGHVEQGAIAQALYLCDNAEPQELTLSDEALRSLLEHLPQGWYALRTKPNESDADAQKTEDRQAHTYLIAPRDTMQLTHPPLSFSPVNWAQKINGEDSLTAWSVRFFNLNDLSLADTLVAEEVPFLEDGERFGTYKLIDSLYRKNDAEIYKAVDSQGHIVTLKIFHVPKRVSNSPSSSSPALPPHISRQLRAAQILSNLTHRNLCKIYEVGQFEEKPFIVMEALQAVPLAQLFALVDVDKSYPKANEIEKGSLSAAVHYLLERKKASGLPADPTQQNVRLSRLLPITQLLHILTQVCEAVRMAHQLGVVHRNLNPENILVRANGEPALIEFGESLFESHPLDAPLTDDEVRALSYTSCEAAEGRADLDERADVYSLGAILYHGLVGLRPFVSTRNLGKDIELLRKNNPNNLRKLNTSIPEELELIVQKAIEPDPALRYQSVSAFENDLRHHQLRKITSVSQQRQTSSRSAASSSSNRTMLWAGLVAMFLFFAAIEGATWWWLQNQVSLAKAETGNIKIQLQNVLADAAAKSEAFRMMAPAVLEMARWKLSQGAYADALQHTQTTLSFDPDYADAHLLCAQLSIIGQDFQAALVSLDAYVEAGGKNPYVPALRDACIDSLKRNVSPMERFAKIFTQQGAQTLADAAYKRRELLLEQYAQQVRTAFPDWKIESSGKLGWPDAFATSIGLTSNHRALIQLDDGTLALNLYNTRSTNLSGLKGLPISTLSLARSAITDISPLAELPIKFLNLSGTQVSDISIVKQLPLKALICHDASALSDLSPLSGSSIHYLALDGTQVNDLTPLKGLPLSFLSLVMTPVSDLMSLQNMHSLTDLHFKLTRATDLSPLVGLKLQRLSFDGQSVRSLSPLQGMPLVELYTTSLAAQDLKPLVGMPLKNLALEGASVTDLSPLQNLPLEYLDLSNTSVTDLTPIRSLPLRWLKLASSSVSDISNLSLLPLEYLDISDTSVRDLWPIQHAPLKSIVLFGSQISDLSPLIKVPLSEILFEPRRINTGLNTLRSIATLSKVGVVTDSRKVLYLTPTEFWSTYSTQTAQPDSTSHTPQLGSSAPIEMTTSTNQ